MGLSDFLPVGDLLFRALDLNGSRLHGQYASGGLGLFISTDKQPLPTPNRPPTIGAQFKTFTAFAALGIHQMPQVELALTAVLRTEFDVLLPPRVIHTQFVIGRRTQHVAFVVTQGHVVNMLAVVQRMGDVGPVGVALFEGDGDFGSGNQRQVQAVGVAGVRTGQA